MPVSRELELEAGGISYDHISYSNTVPSVCLANEVLFVFIELNLMVSYFQF